MEEFPAALAKMNKQIDIFFMEPDSKVYLKETINHLLYDGYVNKYAVVGLSSQYTKAGAFVSFNYDYFSVGYQTGALIADIARGGAGPGKGYKSKVKINVSVNITTAERLGCDIDAIRLAGADIFGE